MLTIAQPVVAIETDPPDEYECEVRIFDMDRGRQLVAAIELVSPTNKDRPSSRGLFIAKWASLLKKGVAISIVDLVTIRQFDLYVQLMQLIEHPDPTMSLHEPPIYAGSCRWPTLRAKARLDAWSNTLVLGQPLPTLPLWLSPDLAVNLDLEPSYDKPVTTCGSNGDSHMKHRRRLILGVAGCRWGVGCSAVCAVWG